MKKNYWPLIFLILNLFLISQIVILYLNRFIPMVGHDYSLAIPSMLDSYNHFRLNGLSIQWYTPSFGGGLPAFPNPNNGQFSLLIFLSLLVNPWQAVEISSFVYIALGGMASYYLLNRVLKMHWTSSILGMIFFSANGFIIQRIAVGHLGYQTFPVIAILVVALLDPSIPKVIGGLIFSLVVTMLIHQAGYFLIVVFSLSILIILPLVYLYKPIFFSWKHLIFITLFGGGIALVMSASKLAAVFAFMRYFPRQIADFYPTTGIIKGLTGIALQLLGTMNLAPLLKLIGSHPLLLPNYMLSATGADYGYWEFDMSMSPIVFVIIIFGVYGKFRNPKGYIKSFAENKKWISLVALLFFTWTTIEFTLAKGIIYPILQKLPILSSLHVNPRFAAAFLFPLALLAAIIYNSWVANWSGRKPVFIFIALNLLTLIPLCTYFMIGGDLQNRSYDITKSQDIYNLIRSGNTLTITGIVSGVGNTEALLLHQSNLQPYEPIFGYQLERFFPEIVPGSIWEQSDGYYNMTNPSGYVFPELNGSRPFERILINEKDKMEAFANHKQPDWKLPLYQRILDWVSGLTVLAGVIAITLFGIKRLNSNFHHKDG